MTLALITGGSGHVGANLTRELIDQGIKVRCIDFDKDHKAFEGLDIELIPGSVTDKESLDPIFNNVDIVFHTAAIISLERRNKNLIRLVNVEGTRNVCEAALKHRVKRLIHFSSVDAFTRYPLDEPLLEDRPLIENKNSVPYDLSKADAQRIVLDYCEQGLDASIIHPSGVYGPHDYKPSLFGQTFIDIANGKRQFNINVGYDYVDVRDLCKTAVACVEKGKSGQNYIVSGHYMDFTYLSEIVSQELGRKLLKLTLPMFTLYLGLPFYFIQSRVTGKPQALTIDSIHTIKVQNKNIPGELAKEELGHSPRGIDETLKDTVKFFKDVGEIS
ncbi:MAG: NAD-dependent epimerase/dehydratase family protein [Candidatus Actinomarinales bacterium]|nr:MAG: NAD-dependent epimerase/dehydratase family protein [Candidatus Actinomarinales bacterium]